MRRPTLLIAFALLAATRLPAAEAAGRDPSLGMVGKPLLALVARGVVSLSMMPAGGGDYDFVWATWGDDAANPRTVHLALLRRTSGAPRATWSMRHDGYSPTITPVDGWNFGTRGVVLLQYQHGAASSHAELYGIDAKSVPVVFGSLDGALIETAQVDGATVVKVYQGADLRTPPACFGWDKDRNGLARVPCTSLPR